MPLSDGDHEAPILSARRGRVDASRGVPHSAGMGRITENSAGEDAIESELNAVRRLIRDAVGATPLGRDAPEAPDLAGAGKQLRARLTLRLAPAAGADPAEVRLAAAAIEMVHAASLLHDDVIDGGTLRRGLPSFWARHGMQGAILAGDLLLCSALSLLREPRMAGRCARLIALAGEMCAVETEQELFLRGRPRDAATAERLARGKTGSLFAFAAWSAASPDRPDLAAALLEAGYLAGTIYQLSDDMLDLNGVETEAGKTLGTDAARLKLTAGSASESDRRFIAERIAGLDREAAGRLDRWPAALAAWERYMTLDFRPAMRKNLGH